MALTEDQIQRYSRHILLDGVGGTGQEKLLASKVLVVGAGGLGSPVALYLAAAGVGTLGIIDPDVVDLSNLQRQILHGTNDVGRLKVNSAEDTIGGLNPDTEVVAYTHRLSADNASEIIGGYDFVVEGTDNFPSKFLVNDACIFMNKPFSQGGILRYQGQTMTHVPGTACYRCVYDSAPPIGSVPTCSEAGVFGAIAGMLGTIQAAEALKYLVGVGANLTNQLLFFDALDMGFRKVNVKKNPDCPICGAEPTITELVEYEQPACDIPVTRGDIS